MIYLNCANYPHCPPLSIRKAVNKIGGNMPEPKCEKCGLYEKEAVIDVPYEEVEEKGEEK